MFLFLFYLHFIVRYVMCGKKDALRLSWLEMGDTQTEKLLIGHFKIFSSELQIKLAFNLMTD